MRKAVHCHHVVPTFGRKHGGFVSLGQSFTPFLTVRETNVVKERGKHTRGEYNRPGCRRIRTEVTGERFTLVRSSSLSDHLLVTSFPVITVSSRLPYASLVPCLRPGLRSDTVHSTHLLLPTPSAPEERRDNGKSQEMVSVERTGRDRQAGEDRPRPWITRDAA